MLRLVRWGFSLADAEKLWDEYDFRLYGQVVERVGVLMEIEALIKKLDLAEVINVAYVGSKADKNGRNARQFRAWRTRQIGNINKLLKRAMQTVWERIGKKARRF